MNKKQEDFLKNLDYNCKFEIRLGGRYDAKILYDMLQTLRTNEERPILYINIREDVGNRYILPQALYDKQLERLNKLEQYIDKWFEQLQIDGVNSKGMVLNDIQYLIKERGDGTTNK